MNRGHWLALLLKVRSQAIQWKQAIVPPVAISKSFFTRPHELQLLQTLRNISLCLYCNRIDAFQGEGKVGVFFFGKRIFSKLLMAENDLFGFGRKSVQLRFHLLCS